MHLRNKIEEEMYEINEVRVDNGVVYRGSRTEVAGMFELRVD